MLISPRLLKNYIIILTVVPYTRIVAFDNEQEAGKIGQHALWHRARTIDHLPDPSLALSEPLKPRAAILPYYITPQWIVDHHDFTCVLPVRLAAQMLQDFYESVAGYAAITPVSETSTFQLWLGQIMLEIIAPQGEMVDWLIVQTFALDMLELTKRGYTNTYQINFIHRSTGKMMTFSLYTGLMRGGP